MIKKALIIFGYIIVTIILVMTIGIFFLMHALGFNFSGKLNATIQPNIDFMQSNESFIYFNRNNLYISNLKNKNKNLIASNVGGGYSFNKNGDKIAYITCDGKLQVIDLKHNDILYEENVDTNLIPYNPDPPYFSSNDLKILYSLSKSESDNYIYIVNLETKVKKLLARFNDSEIHGNPRWAKNNEDIYYKYYNYAQKEEKIYKLRHNGQKELMPRKITIDDINLFKIVDPKFTSDYANVQKSSDGKYELSFDNEQNLVVNYNGKLKKLLNSHRGYASVNSLTNFDSTKDFKYVLISYLNKIYVIDIQSGKIGILSEGEKPFIIGKDRTYKSNTGDLFYNLHL